MLFGINSHLSLCLALLAAVWMWTGGLTSSAHADSLTTRQVQEQFLSLATDTPKLAELVYARVGNSPHYRLFLKQYQRIFQLPEFGAKVAEALDQAGPREINYLEFGAELGIALQVKGLRRLTPEAQRRFIDYSRRMIAWLGQISPERCRRLITNQSPKAIELQNVEMEFVASLQESEVQPIMDLYYQAFVSELRDYPPIRELTTEQAKYGDDALTESVIRRLQASEDPLRLADAAERMESAPAKDVCDVGLLSIEALLDLSGPQGDWAITSFVSTLQ